MRGNEVAHSVESRTDDGVVTIPMRGNEDETASTVTIAAPGVTIPMRGNELDDVVILDNTTAGEVTIPMRGNEVLFGTRTSEVWNGYDPHEG